MFPQEASPNNPISSMLNQFPISFSTNHFENQIFDAYETDLRGNCTLYPNSVSPLQSIQSLGERISSCINPVHAPPLVSQEQEINHDPHLLNIVEACNQGVDQMSSDYCFVGSELGSFSTSINQSFETAVFNSKYLKPAQSLLHEVVNVGGQALDSSNEKYVRKLASSSKRGSLVLCSALKAQLCDNGGSNEKNELHFKVSKLIALLEEVERRYEKFHIQMEELVSSFEAIAGEGAGKLYTAFTLQAISRRFSSLRDVTLKEIFKNIPQIKTSLSRFNPFDPSDQMGLSRTSQQTWRPFRGLPDTSVAILRSWIFEHFLNPYPNEPEKLSLAMQTGLSKKQISNWFINARVRVWKPMIEEIYREEFDYSNPVVESCSYTMGGALNHAC